jgi:phospholipid/cholesterol/gamma-HCH transport system ATP-binding protein
MSGKHKKPILSVRDIVNRFGDHTVHEGISFDVGQGEILGIAGGSGSGKSVLLKSMIGLHPPTEGEVRIDGEPVSMLSACKTAHLLGVLFQEGALFSSLNVAQNVMLPLREHTRLKEEDQRIIARFKLALTGLPEDAAEKNPSELSGGMMRRAALARALALDPKILFLDEPTSGLDPINASAFDTLIRELNKGLRATVVLVTHDLDTLFTLCDRVAVLVDKKVVLGTVPELLENDHPWIKEFFHGPRGQGAVVAAKSVYGIG